MASICRHVGHNLDGMSLNGSLRWNLSLNGSVRRNCFGLKDEIQFVSRCLESG